MTKGRPASPELQASRDQMAAYAQPIAPDEGASRIVTLGGIEALEITPAGASGDLTVLHLHGGAYRRGSPELFGPQLARIAGAIGAARFVSVRYRLAPEHPFPGGLDDALAAYRAALEEQPSERIVVWGDSAGGGLAAALLLRIAAEGLPSPRCAVLTSPWADLRVSAASYEINAETDTLFSREAALEAAEEYLAGNDPADPRISAALGDWSGQPPVLVLASRIEVLRDDAVLLADTINATGGTATLELFDDQQHIWVLDYPSTEASRRSIEVVRKFFEQALAH